MPKTARTLGFLLVLAMLYGCGAGTIKVLPLPSQHEFSRTYEIGEVYEVTTGNPILRLGNLRLRPAFTPAIEYEPPNAGLHGKGALVPGQIWQALFLTSGDKGYVIRDETYSPRHAIHILSDGRIGRGWVVTSSFDVLTPGSLTCPFQTGWDREQPLFVSTDDAAEEGDFEAELVYLGLSESTMRVLYREYIGDLARPAFTQELTYDLAESNVVAFRSIRIEVVDATSSLLTCKVVDDGGLDWMPAK